MSPLWIVLLLPILGGAQRFNCKGRILGAYYADAKSGCKAFHVCVRVAGGGIRDFRFFCPPGTLFHQEAQTCTDWGDDDPLACPADIYDGQFDLYRIGSGHDTKKELSSANREEESEFGLQRAETGDRRLTQNNAQNSANSDLRTAHSSDFFTGQRDRGRDDYSPQPILQSSSQPASAPRQSFRRSSTPRPTSPSTQYTPTIPTIQPTKPPQYENKRKLVRKRPIYVSTKSPVYTQTVPQLTSSQPQQNSDRRPQTKNKVSASTASIPPHFQSYKDEYVEVSRVTPKTKVFSSKAYSVPITSTTGSPYFRKKENLVELYNYESQSTPALSSKKEKQLLNVRNSFNVVPESPRDPTQQQNNVQVNYNVARETVASADYTSEAMRGFTSSTHNYRNINSVSYESEKNNIITFEKQNYFSSPIPKKTTTTRPDLPANFNAEAYNTNIGINAQPTNFAENNEDDGQYRPPLDEDDGQYRPEIYERELLSGAHSLNIAASGNRLPDDQKPKAQTASPRPFRPQSTMTRQPPKAETYSTSVVPHTVEVRTFDYYQTYTTTSRPSEIPFPVQSSFIPEDVNRIPTRSTSTSSASETSPSSRAPSPTNRPPPLSSPAPERTTNKLLPSRPSSKSLSFANAPKSREDASYDYAYYDSDPGFSEYDNIEEFRKTKTKKV